MEDNKTPLPVLITKEKVQLQINAAAAKKGLTIASLQQRRLALVINDDADNLRIMAQFLADVKSVEDVAEEIHETGKRPSLEQGRAWDAGKKLVFQETALLKDFKPKYDALLAGLAAKKRQQEQEKAQREAILKGIEDNVMVFSNLIIAAVSKKQLLDVESRINLEKSPGRAKKYGEFHQQAIDRYDTILLPIIRDQKVKVEEIEKLNVQINEAEAANDPDKMDELMARVDEKSNQILQNHSLVQEAALNQESFPVAEATEVLPDIKNKRTNYTYEIVDLEVALKKSRELLEISINKDAAKQMKNKLVEEGAFKGKEEVIRDGIKYIANITREVI